MGDHAACAWQAASAVRAAGEQARQGGQALVAAREAALVEQAHAAFRSTAEDTKRPEALAGQFTLATPGRFRAAARGGTGPPG